MPSKAWVELDCRILPGTTEADVEAAVRDRLAGMAERPRLRPLLARAAHPRQRLPARRRRWSRRSASGSPARCVDAELLPSLGTGFTDSSYLRAAAGTAAYGFSPFFTTPLDVLVAGYHNADERVHVDDLHASVRFHLHLAKALLVMRARDLGIVIGTLEPGEHDAITDVPGVRVGHTTVIEGDDVRTGVTVVVPHDGNVWSDPVYAAYHRLNGNGEMTGLPWLEEVGLLHSPVAHHQHPQRRRRPRRAGRARGRGAAGRRRGVGAARRRRDVGRHPQRRRRLPRDRRARARRPTAPAAAGPVGGGLGRRRHRDDLPRLQGRHRHGVAAGGPRK